MGPCQQNHGFDLPKYDHKAVPNVEIFVSVALTGNDQAVGPSFCDKRALLSALLR